MNEFILEVRFCSRTQMDPDAVSKLIAEQWEQTAACMEGDTLTVETCTEVRNNA